MMRHVDYFDNKLGFGVGKVANLCERLRTPERVVEEFKLTRHPIVFAGTVEDICKNRCG